LPQLKGKPLHVREVGTKESPMRKLRRGLSAKCDGVFKVVDEDREDALQLVDCFGAFHLRPNFRAKLAPAAGRAGQVGENVQGTADLARVARRWGST
jgi:hypothetical protein